MPACLQTYCKPLPSMRYKAITILSILSLLLLFASLKIPLHLPTTVFWSLIHMMFLIGHDGNGTAIVLNAICVNPFWYDRPSKEPRLVVTWAKAEEAFAGIRGNEGLERWRFNSGKSSCLDVSLKLGCTICRTGDGLFRSFRSPRRSGSGGFALLFFIAYSLLFLWRWRLSYILWLFSEADAFVWVSVVFKASETCDTSDWVIWKLKENKFSPLPPPKNFNKTEQRKLS